jgi:hypothetical protein
MVFEQPQQPSQQPYQQQPQQQPAPSPYQAVYAPPQKRPSPVLGYVALGIAVLGVLVGLGEQVAQRMFLLSTHYSAAGFGLFTGVSVTVGILFDLIVIAIAIVALVGRKGTIPAAMALGAGGVSLLSTLGSLLVNFGMSFSG